MITGFRGTKHGEDGGAEAWCERVGMRVAGGGGHLDTHQSVRRSSPRCREDESVGLGGVASGVGMLRNAVSTCPASLELLAGSNASPETFRVGASDSERRAPEGTRGSWPCSAAPPAYLGAAPPAQPEGRVRGVPRAWLCLPRGDQARAGCASFQGFLALPSVRACWRTQRGSAFPSLRAPERAPPPSSAPPAGPGRPEARER